MSLNNLSNQLAETGDRDGALAAITEAVEHPPRLAAASPAAYLPDLAMSLNNLSDPAGRGRAAGGGAGRDHRGRRRSTAGWPRPTRPPTCPTSPCR